MPTRAVGGKHTVIDVVAGVAPDDNQMVFHRRGNSLTAAPAIAARGNDLPTTTTVPHEHDFSFQIWDDFRAVVRNWELVKWPERN